jgi:hypothetical protein
MTEEKKQQPTKETTTIPVSSTFQTVVAPVIVVAIALWAISLNFNATIQTPQEISELKAVVLHETRPTVLTIENFFTPVI